jgi:tripartite-type tricarboxylate transporter receptor subunit TctC
VKVLGIAAKKRQAVLPGVATFEEQGIRDAEAIVWFGMAAPAKTPRAVIAKLNGEVNRALGMPDVRQRLDQLGLEVEGGTPEKFAGFIRSEAARLTKLIQAGAVRPE